MTGYERILHQQAAERAVRRYASALRYGPNARRSDGNTEEQAANYGRAAERLSMRTAQIRQVLNDFAILPMHHMFYCNFGLHVDKLVRQHDGLTLRNMVQAAFDHWTAQGLDPAVLCAICLNVFDITLSVPPPSF